MSVPTGGINSFPDFLNALNSREQWNKAQLIPLVNSLQNNVLATSPVLNAKPKRPDDLQVNDIIVFSINGSFHPCIVVRVDTSDENPERHYVNALTLSTTDGPHVLFQGTSRQLCKSYYTNTLIAVKYSEAIATWKGVYDRPQEIKEAMKKLKKYIGKIA